MNTGLLFAIFLKRSFEMAWIIIPESNRLLLWYFYILLSFLELRINLMYSRKKMIWGQNSISYALGLKMLFLLFFRADPAKINLWKLLYNTTGIGTEFFEFDADGACAILPGCLASIPVKECCDVVECWFLEASLFELFMWDYLSVWFQGDLWFRAIGKDLSLYCSAFSLMKGHR